MTISKKTLAAVKKVKARTIKSNQDFKRMTPAQKRVAIAKDAIAQIKKEKFTPITGRYCELGVNIDFGFNGKFDKNDGFVRYPKNTELQKTLKSIPTCDVCARGALFLSAIRKFNDFKIGTSGVEPDQIDFSARRVTDHERKFFSKEQLSLIETAFESEYEDCEDFYGCAPIAEKRAAAAFGREFETAQERLLAILNNIVKNKGSFVIPREFFEQ